MTVPIYIQKSSQPKKC